MGERSLRRWVALTSVLVGASVVLAPVAAAAPAGVGAAGPGVPTDVAPACAAMTADIHQANNPRTRASIVSSIPAEVSKAGDRYGFTDQLGVVFRAAPEPAEGLEPVYRLYHPRTRDFLWILTEGGRDRAVALHGYQDPQVDFYASVEPVPCAVPVHRYLRGSMHRLAASEADRDALEAGGWTDEGVKFWAATPEPHPEVPVDPEPPTHPGSDSTFTIAVVPDTQYEVFAGDRFADRNRWLVRHRDELDLEFVLHTGDVVAWDTPTHDQYRRASEALSVLDDAGVPTALAIGNHDTAAVAVGGSAVPGGDTRARLRDTSTFNRYFPPSRQSPEGVFEPGKVDNTYQLFSAGGRDWMILTLEMWPRKEVVRWARDVVASHPDHLVIVQTHSYLLPDGSILARRDYGSTPPQYLYDTLVSRYPNIRMVFSGHVGEAASRVDTGVHGNRVASFLGGFHSMRSNPVRLVRIDTATGTISTEFVSPVDGLTWPVHDVDVAGMDFG